MIINLNRDWRIRPDPLQWIVEKRLHGAKTKRHAWKPKAYCNSLDSGVVWAGRRRVMETPGVFGCDALPPLVAALDTIVEEVRAALAAYRKENPGAALTAHLAKPQNPSGQQSKKDREVIDEDTLFVAAPQLRCPAPIRLGRCPRISAIPNLPGAPASAPLPRPVAITGKPVRRLGRIRYLP